VTSAESDAVLSQMADIARSGTGSTVELDHTRHGSSNLRNFRTRSGHWPGSSLDSGLADRGRPPTAHRSPTVAGLPARDENAPLNLHRHSVRRTAVADGPTQIVDNSGDWISVAAVQGRHASMSPSTCWRWCSRPLSA